MSYYPPTFCSHSPFVLPSSLLAANLRSSPLHSPCAPAVSPAPNTKPMKETTVMKGCRSKNPYHSITALVSHSCHTLHCTTLHHTLCHTHTHTHNAKTMRGSVLPSFHHSLRPSFLPSFLFSSPSSNLTCPPRTATRSSRDTSFERRSFSSPSRRVSPTCNALIWASASRANWGEWTWVLVHTVYGGRVAYRTLSGYRSG